MSVTYVCYYAGQCSITTEMTVVLTKLKAYESLVPRPHLRKEVWLIPWASLKVAIQPCKVHASSIRVVGQGHVHSAI